MGERRDRAGVLPQPEQLHGPASRTSKEGSGRLPQQGRIVGIDVSKLRVDACIRSLRQWLSEPSTPTGEAQLIAWLRENGVELAMMEASSSIQHPWAEALRKAGIGVRVVDPKRIRFLRQIDRKAGQERPDRRRDDDLVRRNLRHGS